MRHLVTRCRACHYRREPLSDDGASLLISGQFLREHSVVAEDTGFAGGPLEPIEELRDRINLVVVFAVGEEGGQLGEVWASHGAFSGTVHEAVLDHCGLRVHSRDFVTLRR
jgi:hypothetical protein